MVQWLYYPRSREASQLARQVVRVFEAASPEISSARHNLSSNQVLSRLAPGLAGLGFRVERGKKAAGKIPVPVLFGLNGQLEKCFEADAYHEAAGMGWSTTSF